MIDINEKKLDEIRKKSEDEAAQKESKRKGDRQFANISAAVGGGYTLIAILIFTLANPLTFWGSLAFVVAAASCVIAIMTFSAAAKGFYELYYDDSAYAKSDKELVPLLRNSVDEKLSNTKDPHSDDMTQQENVEEIDENKEHIESDITDHNKNVSPADPSDKQFSKNDDDLTINSDITNNDITNRYEK